MTILSSDQQSVGGVCRVLALHCAETINQIQVMQDPSSVHRIPNQSIPKCSIYELGDSSWKTPSTELVTG